jgi:hypothetical protein
LIGKKGIREKKNMMAGNNARKNVNAAADARVLIALFWFSTIKK